jgi:hypothetical protein
MSLKEGLMLQPWESRENRDAPRKRGKEKKEEKRSRDADERALFSFSAKICARGGKKKRERRETDGKR